MNVEIKSLPALHIAAIRYAQGITPGVHNTATAALFDQVGDWLMARDLFTRETRCLGILHAPVGGTHAYEAAFTVPAQVTAGEGDVVVRDLPGGTYASVRIEVPNNGPGSMGKAIVAMNEAGRYLEDTWLAESGYRRTDAPALEFYLTPPQEPTIVIELCLPVAPR